MDWLEESGIDKSNAKTYAVRLKELGVERTDDIINLLEVKDLEAVNMNATHHKMVLAKLTEMPPVYVSTKPLEATKCMQRGTRKDRARDASKFSTSESFTNFDTEQTVFYAPSAPPTHTASGAVSGLIGRPSARSPSRSRARSGVATRYTAATGGCHAQSSRSAQWVHVPSVAT